MADLLTELEGFLDADTVAKIRANEAVVSRITRASELVEFYDGETTTPPAPPQRREVPPAARPATDGGDLSTVLAELSKVTTTLGGLDDRIATKTNELIDKRGTELLAISMRNTRELSKIDAKHRADFNTDLDDAALNAHAAAAAEAGRPFRTITDAYEDMTRGDRTNKVVEDRVREELKTRASSHVPGVTPVAATPMLSVLKGGRRTEGDAGSKFDAAAAALRARQNDRGEVAV